MTATAPATAPTDLGNTLEEMRASVAAECARKGLAGAVAKAILGFLEMLMALQRGRAGAGSSCRSQSTPATPGPEARGASPEAGASLPARNSASTRLERETANGAGAGKYAAGAEPSSPAPKPLSGPCASLRSPRFRILTAEDAEKRGECGLGGGSCAADVSPEQWRALPGTPPCRAGPNATDGGDGVACSRAHFVTIS